MADAHDSEVFAALDFCFTSFQDRDDETFQNLIASASSLGYLDYLLAHSVGIWHQAHPRGQMPACQDAHTADDPPSPSIATVLTLLGASDEQTLIHLVDAVVARRFTDDGLREQIEVCAGLMVALERSLPAGILPSHCFVVADIVHRAAEGAGVPELGLAVDPDHDADVA